MKPAWSSVLCLVIVDEWEMSFQDMLEVRKCLKHSNVCTSQRTEIRILTGLWTGTQALQETFATYMDVFKGWNFTCDVRTAVALPCWIGYRRRASNISAFAYAFCFSFPFYTFAFYSRINLIFVELLFAEKFAPDIRFVFYVEDMSNEHTSHIYTFTPHILPFDGKTFQSWMALHHWAQ